MSICAITTGDQNCKAVINLLRQDIVLDADKNYDASFIDIVIENQKGELKNIDIYFPYTITYFEDRTFSLLDERNKYHYQNDKYKIIEKSDYCKGTIQIEIQKTFYKINVGKVEVKKDKATIGSKIITTFNPPILTGERRANRILFYCERFGKKITNTYFETALEYYSNKHSAILGLSDAFNVENLFVHIVFPPKAQNIKSIPEPDKTTPFNESDLVYMKYLECLFGSKTSNYYTPFRRTFEFFKYKINNNKPVLYAWENFPITCSYSFEKDQEEKTHSDFKEKQEFARMWNNDAEPEGELIFKGKYNEKKEEILNRKNEFDLIIIREETLTQVFIKGEKIKTIRGKLTYRILSYVLKHKGTGGTAWNIAKNVWSNEEVIKYGDLREISKALKYHEGIEKGKAQELAGDYKDVVSKYSKRITRKIIDLNEFLKKLDTKLEANNMDEYEFNQLISYCLIEKILNS